MTAERNWFLVQTGLRDKLGQELGDLVMEYLPPEGWGHVARIQDVEAVRTDIRSSNRELEIVRRDVSRVDRSIKWFVGVYVASFMGMFALQVQTLLTVSRL